MDNDFKNKMINLSKIIKVEITNDQIEMYYKYMKLLLEWNKKINITAITEVDDIILKHFIDSMTVLKYIDNATNIIDVGTGAGFPGIPIAIMKHDINITLLDSLNKRIVFLDEVCDNLKVNHIKTIHGRAEEYGQNREEIEKYNIAISRAVANMTTLAEYLIPFVKIGGYCICMKGSEIESELEQAKKAIKELGGEIEKVDCFNLPNSDMERNIVIIKKVKETPNRYPRKAGIPQKLPMFHTKK